MVVRRGVGTPTGFVTPADPRSRVLLWVAPRLRRRSNGHSASRRARSRTLATQSSTRSRGLGLPLYALNDFEDADFARTDSLTRGQVFVRQESRPATRTGVVVKDAHAIVNELRAKKSAAEIALLRRAAEMSDPRTSRGDAGHRFRQHEYEIQAVLEYNFTRLGGTRPAYRVDCRLRAKRNAACTT